MASGASTPPPAAIAPLRPTPAADRPSRAAAVRNAPPVIAGPMVVLLVVVAVVGGALLVAALSGRGDAGTIAAASPTPLAAAATPTAQSTPAKPTPDPKPTPAPKPTPKPPPNTPSKGARDVCDPFLGIDCGLDPGIYEPSKFTPPIHFELGAGWAVSVSEADLLALTRDEGTLTFASGITTVYPSGTGTEAPDSARALVETFIETDGVAAGKPTDGKIDKLRTRIVDLTPTGSDRVALFGTNTQTFYLEPVGTTRLTVVDGRDGPVVIAVEPAEDATFTSIRKITDPVIKSFSFR